MERRTQTTDIPRWSDLLVEAVNKPGLIMEAYSAFHNYSILCDRQHRMLNVNYRNMLIARRDDQRGASYCAPELT